MESLLMKVEKQFRAGDPWKTGTEAKGSADEKYDTPSLTRNEYACTLVVHAQVASSLL
jgi:hypothetical protein